MTGVPAGVGCRLGCEALLDLGSGRVRCGGAVREEDGGDGLVSAVQLLHEFGGPEMLLETPEGILPLSQMLPQAFGPEHLRK